MKGTGTFYTTKEQHDKWERLARELNPDRPNKSAVIARLLELADVQNGRLVLKDRPQAVQNGR